MRTCQKAQEPLKTGKRDRHAPLRSLLRTHWGSGFITQMAPNESGRQLRH